MIWFLMFDDARSAVGRVALGADALVPVVVGRGGVLRLHGFQPRVLARRLVEVTVNADKTLTGWHEDFLCDHMESDECRCVEAAYSSIRRARPAAGLGLWPDRRRATDTSSPRSGTAPTFAAPEHHIGLGQICCLKRARFRQPHEGQRVAFAHAVVRHRQTHRAGPGGKSAASPRSTGRCRAPR